MHLNIPKDVLLCGIAYTVKVIENAVVFSQIPGVANCYMRLAFERRAGCWYVCVCSSSDTVMVSHIREANRLVEEWFGGNHESPRGENNL